MKHYTAAHQTSYTCDIPDNFLALCDRFVEHGFTPTGGIMVTTEHTINGVCYHFYQAFFASTSGNQTHNGSEGKQTSGNVLIDRSEYDLYLISYDGSSGTLSSVMDLRRIFVEIDLSNIKRIMDSLASGPQLLYQDVPLEEALTLQQEAKSKGFTVELR